MAILDNIGAEFKERNFSIYGQWTAILTMILCLALGIANIFTLNAIVIVFSILCLITGLLIIFLEVPLLLRICPTSPKFDEALRKLHNCWGRAGFYAAASAVQWLSLVSGRATSLICPAVLLIICAIFYALAAVKNQEFTGSKTLGGAGIAQMIV